MLYALKKFLFRFLANIRWLGRRHPFWFAFGIGGYRLKGHHYRQVADRIQPGDVLLRRFDGYVNTWLIPGWWNHAGIYTGGENHQVVHAIGDGVVCEDLIDFCRTDYLLLLRGPDISCKKAVLKAHSLIGRPYDFDFNFKDAGRFCCTELIAHLFPGLIKGCRRLWRDTIVADDIAASTAFSHIWDSRLVMKCETR